MKRMHFFLFAITCFCVFAMQGRVTAQTNWTKYSGNPVVPHGPSGAWDEARAEFGWVVFDNGTYKMWYTGVNNSSTKAIGYATSPDGITWTKHSGNPVMSTSQAWEELEISIPAVIKDGGTYKMWYTGITSSEWRIGYATSIDGITWAKYSGNPVMTGTPGQWDANFVKPGTIILDGGIFKMWYGGPGGGPVGYATSVDGINWTKYSGNPVLSGDNDVPSVLKVGSDYHMWHHLPGTGSGTHIGYATSTDGMTWTEFAGNPVL